MSPNIETVEEWPIDKLTPYARNARTHSPKQVDQIASSITEWGFTNPIIADAEGNVIAGHGRLLASQKLGLKTVPVRVVTNWPEAKKKAYILADNKLALNAGWDEELLRLELEELKELDFDLDLIGFEDFEIAEIVNEPIQLPPCDVDEVMEPPANPTSKKGDIWILGDHRVMCGDSTIITDVEALMAGRKASLLHADPPYGMGKQKDGVANDNLYGENLDSFQMEWWATFRPFIEGNASVYIWGNAPALWRLWYLGGLGTSERLSIRNEIVWDKNDAQGMNQDGRRMFAPVTERCLFFMVGEQECRQNSDNYWEGFEPIRSYLEDEMKKCGWKIKDLNRITGTQMGCHWVTKSQWQLITEPHYIKIQEEARGFDAFKRDHDSFELDYDSFKRNCDSLRREFYGTRAFFDNTHDSMTDVWQFNRVVGEERHGHATPKPVAMMERVMRSSLPAGGLCVEPFGGSGSTLIGAELTGRICYTMELNPIYCDVIVERWQKITGKKAINEATGNCYDEEKN